MQRKIWAVARGLERMSVCITLAPKSRDMNFQGMIESDDLPLEVADLLPNPEVGLMSARQKQCQGVR